MLLQVPTKVIIIIETIIDVWMDIYCKKDIRLVSIPLFNIWEKIILFYFKMEFTN